MLKRDGEKTQQSANKLWSLCAERSNGFPVKDHTPRCLQNCEQALLFYSKQHIELLQFNATHFHSQFHLVRSTYIFSNDDGLMNRPLTSLEIDSLRSFLGRLRNESFIGVVHSLRTCYFVYRSSKYFHKHGMGPFQHRIES